MRAKFVTLSQDCQGMLKRPEVYSSTERKLVNVPQPGEEEHLQPQALREGVNDRDD